MVKVKTEDLQRFVKEYFRHPRGMFLFDYKFSVHAGWSYEGIQFYAYDVEHNFYIKQHITPEEVDDAERGRKGFGEVFGKAVGELRDRIIDHESYYVWGYW